MNHFSSRPPAVETQGADTFMVRAIIVGILLGRASNSFGFVRPSLTALRTRRQLQSLCCVKMADRCTERAASSTAAAGTAASRNADSTLFAHGDYVSTCELVLASQSPRRLEIVGMMGLGDRVRVVVSNFEENLDKSSFKDPRDYAVANAEGKAREVAGRVLGDSPEVDSSAPMVVVGSDTIVELDGRILEKPIDDEDAFSMLSSLSGRKHLVHSGVSVFTGALGKDEAAISFCETTEVLFASLSPQEIHAYIRTREPMDKSGSYGIQGAGGQFVRKVDGCFFNVMGFPMHAFSREMGALIEQGRA